MSKAVGALAVVALLLSSVAIVLVLLPTERPEQSWCSYNEVIYTVPISTNITIGEHTTPFAITESEYHSLGIAHYLQFHYVGKAIVGWMRANNAISYLAQPKVCGHGCCVFDDAVFAIDN